MQHSYNKTTFTYNLRDDTDNSVFREIFVSQEYKAAHDSIKNASHPILDIGAHAGFFSLLCHCLNKTVPIYAIEPAPDNLTALELHIQKNNLQTIIPIAGALGGSDGQRLLQLSTDSIRHKVVNNEKGIMNNGGKKKRETQKHLNFASLEKENECKNSKSTKVQNYIPIQCFSLKNITSIYNINRISLIKMDIEGGEYDILLHLGDMRQHIGAIILEYHTNPQLSYANPKKLIQTFQEQGFAVEHFPSHYEKHLGFLFARNKRWK